MRKGSRRGQQLSSAFTPRPDMTRGRRTASERARHLRLLSWSFRYGCFEVSVPRVLGWSNASDCRMLSSFKYEVRLFMRSCPPLMVLRRALKPRHCPQT